MLWLSNCAIHSVTQHSRYTYVINVELCGIYFNLGRWAVSTSNHMLLSESLKWNYCAPHTADEAFNFKNKILSNMILMATDCPLCYFIERCYLKYIGYEIEWEDISFSNSFADRCVVCALCRKLRLF
jgi:hypothetical protein